MSAPLIFLTALQHCLLTAGIAFFGLGRLLLMAVRPRSGLAAENLCLRKQLALFQRRKVKLRRANDATRWLMAVVSRLFDWRTALVVVKLDTLIRWHRKGFRLFWHWKSKPTGRPRLPSDLQQLIRKMAVENPTWGGERIANELKLKLGIRISPRTMAKYVRIGGPVRTPDPKQRWLTFTQMLRTPIRAPMADSVCERLGGTLRRECLDFLIPINERHLRMTIKEWGIHYNRGRPHPR